MKTDLEHQITESLRLYERITGRKVRHLAWSYEEKAATVVVGEGRGKQGNMRERWGNLRNLWENRGK